MTNDSAIGIILEYRFRNFQRILAGWISDLPLAPEWSLQTLAINVHIFSSNREAQ
jgi:hypothetical protein